MGRDVPRSRWEPRVRMEMIRRLYESDAKGFRDEDLANEVGYALYARCLSMIEASEALDGKVRCPSCARVITHDGRDDTVLHCAQCGWRVTWKTYRKTLRRKKVAAPGILVPLRAFAEAFPQCRSYRDKMLEIDRLIHTFHAESRKWPTSPIAKNVIEGNIREIVEFLDGLAYSPNTTPEVLAMREAYQATLARSWAGGCPRPKDWRKPIDGEVG